VHYASEEINENNQLDSFHHWSRLNFEDWSHHARKDDSEQALVEEGEPGAEHLSFDEDST
jgi:hypothetical protein